MKSEINLRNNRLIKINNLMIQLSKSKVVGVTIKIWIKRVKVHNKL